jgi:hypothetical protein
MGIQILGAQYDDPNGRTKKYEARILNSAHVRVDLEYTSSCTVGLFLFPTFLETNQNSFGAQLVYDGFGGNTLTNKLFRILLRARSY